LKTNALKGQNTSAQGNALCNKMPPTSPKALKGRNQEDVALSGLKWYGANPTHRALPYANDNKAFSLN